MSRLLEQTAELAAEAALTSLGYNVHEGTEATPGEAPALRERPSQVILLDQLRGALTLLNNNVFPASAIAEAEQKLTRLEGVTTLERNRHFWRLLTEGIPVDFKDAEGQTRTGQARVFDFTAAERNTFTAIRQFTVKDSVTGKMNRPDLVVFINGLPLVVIELKAPSDMRVSWQTAYEQIQRYKEELPTLFDYNALCIASDGMFARYGSLTADKSRFMPWRSTDGLKINPKGLPELETLLRGLLAPARLLELIRGFMFFEEQRQTTASGSTQTVTVKKVAGYHQYYTVKKALASIIAAERAPAPPRRGGVIWHTQGSGKSITMLLLAGQLALASELRNPTLVIVTDRRDLDEQLFLQFAAGKELLRTVPEQAESKEDLQRLLGRTAGGVVFTTMQKFEEWEEGAISGRSNVIVLADEAHRTQYGFEDGFARKLRSVLPNAVYVGFTGTPIELVDRNTRNVFGDYVDVYDVQRSIEDQATVPIYYQSRLVDLHPMPGVDQEELYREALEAIGLKPENVRGKVRLEHLVGHPDRLRKVAEAVVTHFEERDRVLYGKAMVVCMSRDIAARLYEEIIRLRPAWHHADDDKGFVKVVITGSKSDLPPLAQHVRTDRQRLELGERFKQPDTSFRMAIVCDMWLTGFDVPCLHTMYVDKPLGGHALMQAIARVNRVYGDKPSGLIVDLLGIFPALERALAIYAQYDPSTRPVLDQREVLPILKEKYELAQAFFSALDYSAFFSGNAAAQMQSVRSGADEVLSKPEGKKRFLDIMASLSQAFAMAVPQPEAEALVRDLGYFQAVRAVLRKTEPQDEPVGGRQPQRDASAAVRQVINGAVVAGEVINLFRAAGLRDAEVSLLDERVLSELRSLPQKNLALEVLRRLLNDEIRSIDRSNVVKGRAFREELERVLNRYRNRAIDTVQVIEELIALAQQVREEPGRAASLGMSREELAFYDALATAKNAEEVLGVQVLRDLARELTERIHQKASIDWALKDSVRAEMRAIVKRLLRKYKYPPEAHDEAADTIIAQAERLAGGAAVA